MKAEEPYKKWLRALFMQPDWDVLTVAIEAHNSAVAIMTAGGAAQTRRRVDNCCSFESLKSLHPSYA